MDVKYYDHEAIQKHYDTLQVNVTDSEAAHDAAVAGADTPPTQNNRLKLMRCILKW